MNTVNISQKAKNKHLNFSHYEFIINSLIQFNASHPGKRNIGKTQFINSSFILQLRISKSFFLAKVHSWQQCYCLNMARLFNKKPIHPLLYKGMVERTFHLKNGGIEPIKTLSCLIARIGKLATIILIIFLRYTLWKYSIWNLHLPECNLEIVP